MWAMTVTSRSVLSVTASDTATAPTIDLGTGTAAAVSITSEDAIATTNGTGAGQADRVFSDRRTLTASSTEDLDLAGGVTDAFGNTITFARIKSIKIKAATANTNTVVIGAAGSNQWTTLLNSTGTVTLNKGGIFMAACGSTDSTGWTVTAGTGDLLKIANGGAGTSVTYDITIVGCSA